MKIRKNSLSDMILLALEKTVDGYVRVEDFTTNTYIYAKGYDRPLKKSSLAQALKRLREKGFIEKENLDNQIIFKLTQSGANLLDEFSNSQKIWDNKWRIVIFDIPEQKRIIRNMFRRNLKKWGFKHLQKSVWISKRDVFDKLKKYVEDLGISQWVVIIEADRLSDYSFSDAIVHMNE